MGDSRKIEFDLSAEASPNNCFRSSFARSFAFEFSRQSKSLDYSYLDASTVSEEDEDNLQYSGPQSLTADVNTLQYTAKREEKKADISLPSFGFHNSPFVRQAFPARRYQHREVLKSWRGKQESVNMERADSAKDCATHSTTKTNSEQDSPQKTTGWKQHRAPSERVDSAALQTQVETLAWQLQQAEQSRQMYKEVMDQVVKFLKRAHISLDTLQNKMDSNASCRVPRSRSVHTVDTSPARSSQGSDFPRTKSIAQIEGNPTSSTFRDFTWKGMKKTNSGVDEVTPAKLAEDAFRLLRIVQSLLNMNEPDLSQCLKWSLPGSQRSSLTMTDELSSSFHKRLTVGESNRISSPRICSSFLQSSVAEDRKLIDVSSIHSSNPKIMDSLDFESACLTSGLEATFAGTSAINCEDQNSCSSSSSSSVTKGRLSTFSSHLSESNSGSYEAISQMKQTAQHLSEDESGFSSMNSFQDVGLPLATSSKMEGSFQEVGLPVVEESERIPKHRRWSSSPVETVYPPQSVPFSPETLRVLWV